MAHATDLALPTASAERVAPDAATDPVAVAYAGFLASYKPRTRETYRNHLDVYLRWLATLGLHPFDVRRPHLELYLRAMEDAGLKSATRSSRFGVIAQWYARAVEDELTDRNPAVRIARPQVLDGEQRRTWLPQLEALAVLKAAQDAGPREHVLIALLSIVGMRVGEVCSLTVGDVGAQGGWRTVTFKQKGGDTATCAVPTQLVADLDRLAGNRPPDAPLILNEWDRPLERRSAATVLRTCCAAAGVTRDITPHGLRRSAITNMLAAGASLTDVQRQARHKDPRMTMRYDRARYGLDRSAALPYASRLYGMLDAG